MDNYLEIAELEKELAEWKDLDMEKGKALYEIALLVLGDPTKNDWGKTPALVEPGQVVELVRKKLELLEGSK